jgi:hypothetical protein
MIGKDKNVACTDHELLEVRVRGTRESDDLDALEKLIACARRSRSLTGIHMQAWIIDNEFRTYSQLRPIHVS